MSEDFDQLRMLVSLMAHRIRSPLSVITGRAGVLLADARADQQRDLRSIEREAQRISRTIDHVLVIAQIDCDKQLVREWVPVDELASAALVRLGNEQSDLTLGFGIPEGMLVHLDPILGEMLLVTLFENVLRHAPGSKAEILARRDGAATTMEIVDRGPGMPVGAARSLREPMHPGDRRGLGFAVCRSIVHRYGGTVEASAREGGGTCIAIVIPDGAPLPQLEQEVVG